MKWLTYQALLLRELGFVGVTPHAVGSITALAGSAIAAGSSLPAETALGVLFPVHQQPYYYS
jgi:hypothetical protein